MFRNAKVGDKVWSILWGHGVISQITKEHCRPIEILFAKNLVSYRIGGNHDVWGNPELYWHEFEIPDSAHVEPGREITCPHGYMFGEDYGVFKICVGACKQCEKAGLCKTEYEILHK